MQAGQDVYKLVAVLQQFIKGLNSIVNRLALAIVILIIFGIFIFPLFHNNKKTKTVKSELRQIGAALEEYYQEQNKWPSPGARSVAGALSGGGQSKGFYNHARLDPEGRFIDPWENPYRYFFSNDRYVIQSAGPDGEFSDGLNAGEDDYWYAPR